MVNTLALLLSCEEQRRSRYAVDTLSNDGDLYDSDLFVQGLLKVQSCYTHFCFQQTYTACVETYRDFSHILHSATY